MLCSNLLPYMSCCNLVDLFSCLSHLNCEEHESKEWFLFIFESPVPGTMFDTQQALDKCLLNGYMNEYIPMSI